MERINKGTCRILWIFGLNRFYMGEVGKGLLMWLFVITGIGAPIALIMWIADGIKLSDKVDAHNAKVDAAENEAKNTAELAQYRANELAQHRAKGAQS